MEKAQMTAAGLETLREEVARLESEGRDQIAAQIRTAREWGDLKENGEYHAAKEAQAHLETRIKKLRERIISAEIVETPTPGVVGLGSLVEVSDEESGKRSTYTLVAAHEADPGKGLLSVESPVAAALVGCSAGEVAEVPTPKGVRRISVVSVS